MRFFWQHGDTTPKAEHTSLDCKGLPYIVIAGPQISIDPHYIVVPVSGISNISDYVYLFHQNFVFVSHNANLSRRWMFFV